MKRSKQRCHYCEAPAELLCDFVLSFSARPKQPWHEGMIAAEIEKSLSSQDGEIVTCDRPLCRNHATNKGVVFYCGKSGEVDTRDFCPGHAHGPDSKPRFNPIGGPRAG